MVKSTKMNMNAPQVMSPIAPIGQAAGPLQEARKSDMRFRSFCERYLIERSGHFRVGFEKEDAWTCMQDAKGIYSMIRRGGQHLDPEDQT